MLAEKRIGHETHQPLPGETFEGGSRNPLIYVPTARVLPVENRIETPNGTITHELDPHVFVRERGIFQLTNRNELYSQGAVSIKEWTNTMSDNATVFDTHIHLRGRIQNEATLVWARKLINASKNPEEQRQKLDNLLPEVVIKIEEGLEIKVNDKTIFEINANDSAIPYWSTMRGIQQRNSVKLNATENNATVKTGGQSPYFIEFPSMAIGFRRDGTVEAVGHMWSGVEFDEKYKSGFDGRSKTLLKNRIISEEALREFIRPYVVFRYIPEELGAGA